MQPRTEVFSSFQVWHWRCFHVLAWFVKAREWATRSHLLLRVAVCSCHLHVHKLHPAIPHVCLSFCLRLCLGMSQEGQTHPSLDFTAYSTLLSSWRVWLCRRGGLGMWWEEETSSGREAEAMGRGKCGSTQSDRCHMFHSAGISPPVQTRMLCKRLLICECQGMEWQSEWGQLAGLRCHMVSYHGKQTCQNIAGGVNWLERANPMRIRPEVKMKQKIPVILIFKQAVWKANRQKESAWEWPVNSNSSHLSATCLLSVSLSVMSSL